MRTKHDDETEDHYKTNSIKISTVHEGLRARSFSSLFLPSQRQNTLNKTLFLKFLFVILQGISTVLKF